MIYVVPTRIPFLFSWNKHVTDCWTKLSLYGESNKFFLLSQFNKISFHFHLLPMARHPQLLRRQFPPDSRDFLCLLCFIIAQPAYIHWLRKSVRRIRKKWSHNGRILLNFPFIFRFHSLSYDCAVLILIHKKFHSAYASIPTSIPL